MRIHYQGFKGAVASYLPLLFSLSLARCQSPQSSPLESASFEVVAIRPSAPDPTTFGFDLLPSGRFSVLSLTLRQMVSTAYSAKHGTVLGGPDWIDTQRFDINATIAANSYDRIKDLPPRVQFERVKLLLQDLLRERFQLKVRTGEKLLPVYVLKVARNGPKISPLPADAPSFGTLAQGRPSEPTVSLNDGHWQLRGESMAGWATQLEEQPSIDRIVLDETGLKGDFDFDFTWSSTREGIAQSIDDALEDQLGLKLQSQKRTTKILIVESVQKPSPN